jgi:hypothetical protein
MAGGGGRGRNDNNVTTGGANDFGANSAGINLESLLAMRASENKIHTICAVIRARET